MKNLFNVIVSTALTACLVSAFVPCPSHMRPSSGLVRSSRSYRSRGCRMVADGESEDDTPTVYYASEVTEGTARTKLVSEFGEKPSEENTDIKRDRYGPAEYKNFIDGDGFDGGDGQVGCVGDGDNAMEKFDKSEVREKVKASTMVKESKSRQRVAWGSTTGYADQLKEEGMVKTNLYGEDVSKIRRQQFENWRNQQEVTRAQRASISEMDRITGASKGSVPKWKRGKDSYFDTISKGSAAVEKDEDWNKYAAPQATGKKDGTAWADTRLTGDEDITDTVQCVSYSGRPGSTSVHVKNSVMTFEPFHCTFVGDADGFKVAPAEGTLNRRSGEPTTLEVSFKGKGPGDNRIGTLVVETEEDKWIYKVEGATQ